MTVKHHNEAAPDAAPDSRLPRFLRDPLTHFLVAGAVLFGAVTLLGDDAPDPDDANTIRVDRQALLSFMQYRANAFQPEVFERTLDTMPRAELDALVEDYLEEEIFYREARSLGLDESDYIIRQRLVQKLRFMLGDLAAAERPDTRALETWFESNREAYAVAPSLTFTHVYFDADKRGAEQARRDAEAALEQLNQAEAGFHDNLDLGDRFPFLRNYVERTPDYVADHFGADFAGRLSDMPASDTDWRGPFASGYGQHLVLLTKSSEQRLPELEEVRTEVERDWQTEQSEARLEELARSLRERYEVDRAPLREQAVEDDSPPSGVQP